MLLKQRELLPGSQRARERPRHDLVAAEVGIVVRSAQAGERATVIDGRARASSSSNARMDLMKRAAAARGDAVSFFVRRIVR